MEIDGKWSPEFYAYIKDGKLMETYSADYYKIVKEDNAKESNIMKSDLEYRNHGMFTRFYPNTPAGETP